MKNICVVGVGYVGIVTAACFADLGNRVVALDIDEKKIEGLKAGKMPIYEPGLNELIQRNVDAGRLSFTTDYPMALEDAEYAFIAVGTPSGVDGEADLQYVAAAARSITCAAVSCTTNPGPVITTSLARVFRLVLSKVNRTIGR